jgi:hypothetical protein
VVEIISCVDVMGSAIFHFLDNRFSLIWPIYPLKIYTDKRMQEHLDSHLTKEEHTTKKGKKNYGLSTSLISNVLS